METIAAVTNERNDLGARSLQPKNEKIIVDDHGKKVLEESYFENILESRTTYVYNEMGYLRKSVSETYDITGNCPGICQTETCFYNDDGLIMERIHADLTTGEKGIKTLFMYSESGLLLEKRTVDQNDKMKTRLTYSYEPNGRLFSLEEVWL